MFFLSYLARTVCLSTLICLQSVHAQLKSYVDRRFDREKGTEGDTKGKALHTASAHLRVSCKFICMGKQAQRLAYTCPF